MFKNGGVLSRHDTWTNNNVNQEIVNKFGYVGVAFRRQIKVVFYAKTYVYPFTNVVIKYNIVYDDKQ